MEVLGLAGAAEVVIRVTAAGLNQMDMQVDTQVHRPMDTRVVMHLGQDHHHNHNHQRLAMALREDQNLPGNELNPLLVQLVLVRMQTHQAVQQKVLGRELEKKPNEKRKNGRRQKPRRKEGKTLKNDSRKPEKRRLGNEKLVRRSKKKRKPSGKKKLKLEKRSERRKRQRRS